MPALKHLKKIRLEGGASLEEVTIAYETYGYLNTDGSNVIWVFHALTGSAKVDDWWEPLIGPGKLLDTRRYYIVCANVLGSCYGTTGPQSKMPGTQEPFGLDFPLITIRDMVRVHDLLREQLGVERIYLGIGGSLGGQQLLEWAVQKPELFAHIIPMATNAQHSPWGIAFNEAQRMALEADPSLHDKSQQSGAKGLEAARAVAMLSYRNYGMYQKRQLETGSVKLEGHKAGTYQRYQGQKLRQRFNAWSYLTLSKAMDSHDLGRHRGGLIRALKKIKARTLVIGIESDLLFPVEEQGFLARHIPGAQLNVIESPFGHDGFLVETTQLEQLIRPFLSGERSGQPFSRQPLRNLRALPGSELF